MRLGVGAFVVIMKQEGNSWLNYVTAFSYFSKTMFRVTFCRLLSILHISLGSCIVPLAPLAVFFCFPLACLVSRMLFDVILA